MCLETAPVCFGWGGGGEPESHRLCAICTVPATGTAAGGHRCAGCLCVPFLLRGFTLAFHVVVLLCCTSVPHTNTQTTTAAEMKRSTSQHIPGRAQPEAPALVKPEFCFLSPLLMVGVGVSVWVAAGSKHTTHTASLHAHPGWRTHNPHRIPIHSCLNTAESL